MGLPVHKKFNKVEDTFVGKPIAFLCSSEVGMQLIHNFGKLWTPETISYASDKTTGHIVGTVMHQNTVTSRSKKLLITMMLCRNSLGYVRACYWAFPVMKTCTKKKPRDHEQCI